MSDRVAKMRNTSTVQGDSARTTKVFFQPWLIQSKFNEFCMLLSLLVNQSCNHARSLGSSYFVFIQGPPTRVTLTRSEPSGDVEFGKALTYTCTSEGGLPHPTVEFFAGSTAPEVSGLGPAITHVVVADDSVQNKTMKCVAKNSHGRAEDSEIITIFCQSFWPTWRKLCPESHRSLQTSPVPRTIRLRLRMGPSAASIT